MRLIYLPNNLTNYNDQSLEVDYSGFNCVYDSTQEIYELFTLIVNGKESKFTIQYIHYSDLMRLNILFSLHSGVL